ncbi:serine hydrolase domain-containing protein [Lactiplantibacillus sp. WILCCON 0030]|uniref:Serine hydrolase domain-containing protein n=1 Tax=Lactiplantibacillus brownii TaxID=3069269 RepID=A0ABU1A781_9LACO|nr:serine hydrolase domain-containing protein [Lactiplantibacillus brownii]MDQ7936788.1 serine hydrolase domain-containing protein [Lactiplantibacillus brownii]
MHFQQPNWRYRLGILILAVVGIGGILAMTTDLLQPSPRTAKPTPTTVVAKPKPANATTKTAVKRPLSTVVNNQSLDRYMTNLHFSGSILVVRDNRIVLRKGYGWRNRKTELPNEVTTPYYIGSAQKAVIATAILQLQDAGKLTVDDPVSKFLPNFPNGHQIKLRHLLTHTSGLIGHAETNAAITPKALVKDIEKQGIRAQPGQWHYLDSNYTVLAYLVEKVSGQPLMPYLEKHIFKPAGMATTGTYQTFDQIANHSTGYKIKNGVYTTPTLPDLSQLYGCGNLYMTVSDMYRFDHALMTNRLISKAARKTMLTAGSSSTYGMGFYANPASYSSHGVLSGWNIANNFSHNGQTYIVIMSNIQNGVKSYGQVASDIYGILNRAETKRTPALSHQTVVSSR